MRAQAALSTSNVLAPLLVLVLAALTALGLALRRRSPPESALERAAAARALAAALGAQTLHFAEEWAAGFPERLGVLLGPPAMSNAFFLVFNLVWLVVWAVSIPALRAGRPLAFFAAWFLAVAAMLNAVAHPLLALAGGGYFPGLMSSPLIGVAGLWLWRRLERASRPRAGAPPAAAPRGANGREVRERMNRLESSSASAHPPAPSAGGRRQLGESGMSLLGLVLGLGVVAIVVWLVLGHLAGAGDGPAAGEGADDPLSTLDHARQRQTIATMTRIARANDLRRAETGRYAERLADLAAPGQPLELDGWGGPFAYRRAGAGYTLTSLGSDRAPGPTPPQPWTGPPYDADLILIDGHLTQAPDG